METRTGYLRLWVRHCYWEHWERFLEPKVEGEPTALSSPADSGQQDGFCEPSWLSTPCNYSHVPVSSKGHMAHHCLGRGCCLFFLSCKYPDFSQCLCLEIFLLSTVGFLVFLFHAFKLPVQFTSFRSCSSKQLPPLLSPFQKIPTLGHF